MVTTVEQVKDEVHALLRAAAEKEASDVHLVPGYPPSVRVHGQLESAGAEPLTPEHVRRMVESITHQITANRQLVDVIRRQDEAALPKALQLLAEIGAESTTVMADWNELLIKALSR